MNLGEGFTSIREMAFSDIAGLMEISIPESVTVIGQKAFYDYGFLETIELTQNVMEIQGDAFRCCGIRSIEIPDGVKEIDKNAFSKLEEGTMVASLGREALRTVL